MQKWMMIQMNRDLRDYKNGILPGKIISIMGIFILLRRLEWREHQCCKEVEEDEPEASQWAV